MNKKGFVPIIVGACILILLISIIGAFYILNSGGRNSGGKPQLSCGSTMGDALNGFQRGNDECYKIYKERGDKCVDEAIDYINQHISGAPHFNVKRYGELTTPYVTCIKLGKSDICQGKEVVFRYKEYSGTTQVGDHLGAVNHVWCDTKNELYRPTYNEPCSVFGAVFDRVSNRCEFFLA